MAEAARPAVAKRPLLLLSGAVACLLISVSPWYGPHRDEMAAAAVVLPTGLIARELGGERSAQVLAAAGMAVAAQSGPAGKGGRPGPTLGPAFRC